MGSPVAQWQLVSTDPEGTAKFYGKLFGWKLTSANALGYRVVETMSPKVLPAGFGPRRKARRVSRSCSWRSITSRLT